MYKLKDFVTEDMLKDSGFTVMSKTNNVNGCYPLIWRARRGHLCVYIGIDKEEKIVDGNFFAYNSFDNLPETEYIKHNIFYSEWEQSYLTDKYAIKDLIDLGYIEVIEKEAQK
jgi:hypothetical protein